MLETLDLVASTELDHRQLAEQLLAQAKEHGVDLVGPNGLLNLASDSRRTCRKLRSHGGCRCRGTHG